MDFIGGEILNLIGGTIRWFFVSIYRKLTKKENFSYDEYLYGKEKINDDYNKLEHEFANKVIAFMFFIFSILLFTLFKIL